MAHPRRITDESPPIWRCVQSGVTEKHAPTCDVFIALGSNLGDRRVFIERAIAALDRSAGVSVELVSSIIETDPVGLRAQGAFLNAVLRAQTSLSPRDLLGLMLEIERSLERVRDAAARWGPRTIDLDLILYADRVICEADLVVPHPRLAERAFVLVPLCEIAPDVIVPGMLAIEPSAASDAEPDANLNANLNAEPDAEPDADPNGEPITASRLLARLERTESLRPANQTTGS
ncbi:2-amino-4-hydroxy-6-hydroxymethyldihydropteridine diphosphokinase [Roseiflexus sp. AH-315-K22]|nr:2-amino-4-hydroxy-6-hydroxymethyldihydropteridine diphosphokinase [Roseiflexus sp. AH-315-K22]